MLKDDLWYITLFVEKLKDDLWYITLFVKKLKCDLLGYYVVCQKVEM